MDQQTNLVILSRLEMPNILCIQLLKSEYMLLLSVLDYCKLIYFRILDCWLDKTSNFPTSSRLWWAFSLFSYRVSFTRAWAGRIIDQIIKKSPTGRSKVRVNNRTTPLELVESQVSCSKSSTGCLLAVIWALTLLLQLKYGLLKDSAWSSWWPDSYCYLPLLYIQAAFSR